MAISSAIRERLEQMEQSKNEPRSILQLEKELQQSKSQLLASKLYKIASMEQRCLKLDRKIAS
uniref:Uncharacterized protein LOC104237158 n=1 Tax=Nicotiana sylvestris TaxID=4096 RepID=A0A1U7XIT7_NICSY|nr:PREDICTED: uncharacterized protein LOC104237158 [Nicotiana sylvestris]